MARIFIFVTLAMAAVHAAGPHPWEAVVLDHCYDCHDSATPKGEVDLETALDEPLAVSAATWERALRQAGAHLMPPPDEEQPSAGERTALVRMLERALDAHSANDPDPGRTATMRRMTRTEYRNVIRDLLALEIDPADFLPPDQESHGFDNITVGDLPPGLLVRYLDAAQEIARRALGRIESSPGGRTVRVRPDLTQDTHREGLPPGTRGGVAFHHEFPRDGHYDLRVRLMRDRNEQVEGLGGTHQLVILVDGEPAGGFTVRPPGKGQDQSDVDAHVTKRLEVKAGRREVTVTFVAPPARIAETLREPYQSAYNMHRHPRRYPALYQVSLTGPYDPGPPADTESRRRVLGEQGGEGESAARVALERLLHRAYRGKAGSEDLERVLGIYREVAGGDGHEAGMEAALGAVLVSPKFLFRIERDPEALASGEVYEVGALDFASRLSFFLWSSLPDEALLEAAASGDLATVSGRAAQVRRMLVDERAGALATNFADQWLYLRNLEAVVPDGRLYPDFDHNLRSAMKRETEVLFDEVRRENRSILALLQSDHTHLNERLARHYGLPQVHGSHFRRVELPPDSGRGGILRHASILTVTSYATRTSPVLRGHWVLENILGTPPPPPPPDIPALEDVKVDAQLPVRERLAVHREQKSCARCHDPMDPVGFAFEHYDAIGQWRWNESGVPVDASGALPDGRRFEGLQGLEDGLLAEPEAFARTLVEKLLVYALGRGLQPGDAPAVRAIVRSAAADDYRFGDLILGLVESPPFRLRKTASPTPVTD